MSKAKKLISTILVISISLLTFSICQNTAPQDAPVLSGQNAVPNSNVNPPNVEANTQVLSSQNSNQGVNNNQGVNVNPNQNTQQNN
jgi:hypothetical protein